MHLVNNVLAFSAGEACTLSGIAYKRLDYWARSHFIAPSIVAPADGNKARRRYGFRDVIELTVARKLRDVGFSLQALRRIQKLLRQEYRAPFAQAWLISDGHDIFQIEEDTESILSVLKQPGQYCLPVTVLDLGRTAEELKQQAAAHLHITIHEIREHIAHGEDSLQKTPKKEHAVH